MIFSLVPRKPMNRPVSLTQTVPRYACLAALMVLLLCANTAPGQTRSTQYKPLPPPGKPLPAATAKRLRDRCQALRDRMSAAGLDATQAADAIALVRAVELAVDQQLFRGQRDLQQAEALLRRAARRSTTLSEAAASGKVGARLGLEIPAGPLQKPTAVAGGFVSQIDGSVQPFGLVLPAGWSSDDANPRRLDVWLHGRGDTKTEMPFLTERLSKTGPITPAGTLVLHPFGRHCNAFKFAGETDVFEAIEDVARRFAIDRDRISIRGFSMGGAGCWHLALHTPGTWFAANPGAGFADTVIYQGWDRKGIPFAMTPARKKLLRWYDGPPWARNLKNLPVIAYSGENDKQKLAADTMLAASRAVGHDWPHVIGPGMGHKIDAGSAKRMAEQLRTWADAASPQVPDVDFTTYTLRYSRCDWLSIEGMREHWTPARVQGSVDGGMITLTTDGCTHLRISLAPGGLPTGSGAITVKIDGVPLAAPDAVDGRPYVCDLKQIETGWAVLTSPDGGLRKRPGLQGPIDDALTQPFVFVRPSRPCWHGVVERWLSQEVDFAVERWEQIMRGRARVVGDREVDAALVADHNLILFGDPRGNRVLSQIIDRLPIEWTRETLRVGEQRFDVTKHAVVMVFPNPLNPARYVVLNSGLTFREFSNVTNSRQIAMLPDWAVIDVSARPDGMFPGKVVAEGFFNEQWQLD